MKKYLLMAAGWISVALGTIGIFLPLLPTTPFLLLAAWCFAKSSKRFHTWLLEHKYFGKIISSWQDGNGISPTVRNRAIAAIWIGMSISAIIIDRLWTTLMLCFIGTCVSIYLWRKTAPTESNKAS